MKPTYDELVKANAIIEKCAVIAESGRQECCGGAGGTSYDELGDPFIADECCENFNIVPMTSEEIAAAIRSLKTEVKP
jgi:hypothetical protein